MTTSLLDLTPDVTRRLADGCVLTIGNFDGIHLGHRALIEPAVTAARELGVPAAAMTFEPHPVAFFRSIPDNRFRLTTAAERETLLYEHGIDVVITVPFSREFASVDAETFVLGMLLGQLQARRIDVGYDFNFGKGRSGTTHTLERLAGQQGVSVAVHDAVRVDDEPVSSTRVRRALESGDLTLLRRLLGRRYRFRGVTEAGAGRGQKMGVPTLNLYPEGVLLPPRGVYATRVQAGAEVHNSISNLGVRPSFDDGQRVSFETMVLDGTPDIGRGERIDVELVGFVRDERAFESPDALRRQIAIDVAKARQLHAAPAVD